MGTRDWRVAIVGAGPAGMYAAEALRKRGASVDIFEKQFAPFGLVRYGVAPDHQKIKRTQVVFERILASPQVRFFGNVALGRELSISDLSELYDQILITVGSSGARQLGVAGEELAGSVSATEFVAWYNGHPDFYDRPPDLDCEEAVVVGMGNVAIDVARILVRNVSELASTDLHESARDVLAKSRIRRVTLLARRGPNQAAFDEKEVRELAALTGVGVSVAGYKPRRSTQKSDLMASFPRDPEPQAERQVIFHFCVSPREIQGTTRAAAVKIERNHLFESAAGMRAVGSGEFSILPAGLVVRAIGYQAEGVEGVPLVEATGTIPNSEGRVLESIDGPPVGGLYVAGWIKRGPTGLIGTNKACSVATVESMERDLDQVGPARDDGSILQLLKVRGAEVIDYQDWQRLDEFELSEGAKIGSVRKKLLNLQTALEVLGRG